MSQNKIILNSSHFVYPNKYIYKFPSTLTLQDGDQIAVASVAIYNSFFNIMPQYNNTSFQIKWINGTVYTVNLPNGYYAIPDINYFLVEFCRENKLYMINNATLNPVLFYTIEPNNVEYTCKINCYAVPNASQASSLNYSIPSGATWSLPTNPTTPQIYFQSNSFNKLLGFNANTYYPPTPQSTLYMVQSSSTPEISVVNSLNITSNLSTNSYSIPNNLLHSVQLNNSFGNQMNFDYYPPLYSDCSICVANQLEITFYDQYWNIVQINDPEATIQISLIKAKK